MVKLFTDEEMELKCRDFQPIPFSIEQQVLHYEGNPDNVSILNGVIKSPYKIGQPVNNVSNYAYQLPFNIPIDPEKFLNSYNNVVEQKIKDFEKRMEQETEEIDVDFMPVKPVEEEKSRSRARTSEQQKDYVERLSERKQMRSEDKIENQKMTKAEEGQQKRRARDKTEL